MGLRVGSACWWLYHLPQASRIGIDYKSCFVSHSSCEAHDQSTESSISPLSVGVPVSNLCSLSKVRPMFPKDNVPDSSLLALIQNYSNRRRETFACAGVGNNYFSLGERQVAQLIRPAAGLSVSARVLIPGRQVFVFPLCWFIKFVIRHQLPERRMRFIFWQGLQ